MMYLFNDELVFVSTTKERRDIRNVPGSNVDPETWYPVSDIRGFMTISSHILPN